MEIGFDLVQYDIGSDDHTGLGAGKPTQRLRPREHHRRPFRIARRALTFNRPVDAQLRIIVCFLGRRYAVVGKRAGFRVCDETVLRLDEAGAVAC